MTEQVTIDVEPLSNPAAPQMNDLNDELEVELMMPHMEASIPAQPPITSWTPPRPAVAKADERPEESQILLEQLVNESAEGEDSDDYETDDDDVMEETPAEIDSAGIIPSGSASPAVELDSEVADQTQADDLVAAVLSSASAEQIVQDVTEAEISAETVASDKAAVDREAVPSLADTVMEMEESLTQEEADSLFFVDTEPVSILEQHTITYETASAAPLGGTSERAPSPDEEEIVFKRRTFPQPKPLVLEVPAARPKPAQDEMAPPLESMNRVIVSAAQLNRRQKKALRKEKRTRNKGKAREKNTRRLQAYDGSDVEWGSDGPPSKKFLDGEASDNDMDDDMTVLRDYLAGTKLGAKAGGDDDAAESEEDDDEMEIAMSKAYDEAAMLGGDDEFELNSDEEDNPDIETSDDDEIDVEAAISSDSEGGLNDQVANEEEQDGEASDSDSEGDDSSDIGDIRFSSARVGVEEDSDSDDESDDLFNAKDSWDETEWFIRNMEVCLLYPHSSVY